MPKSCNSVQARQPSVNSHIVSSVVVFLKICCAQQAYQDLFQAVDDGLLAPDEGRDSVGVRHHRSDGVHLISYIDHDDNANCPCPYVSFRRSPSLFPFHLLSLLPSLPFSSAERVLTDRSSKCCSGFRLPSF